MYSEKRRFSFFRFFRFIPLALILLVILALLAVTIAALLVTVPTSQETAAGYPRNLSLYVNARDGVQLAIDIWLPSNLGANKTVPTLIQPHRLWRSAGIQGFGGRVLVGLGVERYLTPETEAFLNAGFAVVRMDLRGSGASYGSRPSEFQPHDLDDLSDVLDWILLQPWSNGSIGAIGDGLTGSLVEKLAAHPHPALKAAVLQFSPFDLYQDLAFPGGIFNAQAFKTYQIQKELYDSNSICAVRGWQGALCRFGRFFLVTGVKPGGDDYDQSQLGDALNQHVNQDLYARLLDTTYRDDPIDRFAQTFSETSPYTSHNADSDQKIPLMVFASWLDAATADGALSRFQSVTNPQQVIIGAWSHGGASFYDPFLRGGASGNLNQAEQLIIVLNFLNTALKKDNNSSSLTSQIQYYTLASGEWDQTSTWPPFGIQPVQFFLSTSGEMSQEKPASADDEDLFSPGVSAASGENNRWHTFFTSQPVSYPGGVARPEGYLTYLSPPITQDMQITGAPLLELFLSSATREHDLFVYLEAVNPSGKAAYITEGLLRTRHQKISGDPPYTQNGVYHSFLERNRMFFEEDVPERIQINLFSTSAWIPQGYRLRLAISSTDTSLTGVVEAGVAPFTILHNQTAPSNLTLPVLTPGAGE